MLAELLSLDIYLMILVFARLGGAIMVLPGFGEVTIPARMRLGLALALSVIMLPLLADVLPPPPGNLAGLAGVLIQELMIGIAIGSFGRLLVTGLQVGGTIIAYNTGLGSAQMFDPNAQQQGAITGAFMTTIGVTLLFTSNLHHVMLLALADSYVVFVPGAPFPAGDFAMVASRLVADSFRLGLRIALPVMIISMLIYLSMGLMARLMPQIQVFFIALPVQLLVGFLVLAATLLAGLSLFLEEFANTYTLLLGAG